MLASTSDPTRRGPTSFLGSVLPMMAALVAAAFLLIACDVDYEEGATSPSEPVPETKKPSKAIPLEANPSKARERVAGVEYDDHGDPKGLHRYHKWSERIGQGAQPKGEIAFKHLAALGYKMVISVDGALPEVELAAKYGLRYVHIPIGYDGVPREKALRMIKAVQVAKGPVYFHCHHGKHRGPAGSMQACMAIDGISHDVARKRLKISGTSPKYEGLYRDVAAFKQPTAKELASVTDKDLPSRVKPKGEQAAMVDVSMKFEYLAESRDLKWKALPDHPDVSPPHEARMLWETYREMARLEKVKARSEDYRVMLTKSEEAAIALEKAIRAGDVDAADKHFKVIKKLCNDCHAPYRNNK